MRSRLGRPEEVALWMAERIPRIRKVQTMAIIPQEPNTISAMSRVMPRAALFDGRQIHGRGRGQRIETEANFR